MFKRDFIKYLNIFNIELNNYFIYNSYFNITFST